MKVILRLLFLFLIFFFSQKKPRLHLQPRFFSLF